MGNKYLEKASVLKRDSFNAGKRMVQLIEGSKNRLTRMGANPGSHIGSHPATERVLDKVKALDRRIEDRGVSSRAMQGAGSIANGRNWMSLKTN